VTAVIRRRVLAAAAALAVVVTTCSAATFDQTITAARQLAARHRYGEVVELLAGLEGAVRAPEARYIVAAELGRAYFHLGRYSEAYQRFRQATMIHPDRAETALYLQASAYLVGDLDQALLIFREILASGARGLYLAVTLPGERRFLAEPRVWAALEAHRITMDLDLDRGTVLGLSLGDSRSKVAAALGSSPSTALGSALTAEAGPHLVWAFSFDDRERLREVLINVENVVKYTPYRLGFGASDWMTTPAELAALMGPTEVTSADADHVVVMSWQRPEVTVTAAFGQPRPPRPPAIAPGVAMLRLIRMVRNGE
jgi:tetratricopeptide (TPR) repeat protein